MPEKAIAFRGYFDKIRSFEIQIKHMTPRQKIAIIVAGGSGRRMGKEIPKQFIEIHGKPILMHTLSRFFEADPAIQLIVVLPESQHEYWKNLVAEYNFNIKHAVVKGGVERFFSVFNGLQSVTENSLVAIHDGVRPLVSVETIVKCFQTAADQGNAIPVIPAMESIRKVIDNKSKAVNRDRYFMVQTPQVFQSEIILKAYQQEYDCNFTDDASVIEKAGYMVHLVEGNVENIKITRPVDLKIAEALFE